MTKKIRDIWTHTLRPRLNFGRKKRHPLAPPAYHFKKTPPVCAVRDLVPPEEVHYRFIKGKRFSPPRFLGRLMRTALVAMTMLLLINTINVYYRAQTVQREITASAEEGYELLLSAGKNATHIQFTAALKAFESALAQFIHAEDKLWFIHVKSPLFREDQNIIRAADALLKGGKHFALAGGYFVEALEEFNKLPLYFVKTNTSTQKTDTSITDIIKRGIKKTDAAIEETRKANTLLSEINEKVLPKDMQAQVTFAKNKLSEVVRTLSAIADHFPALLKMLGDTHPHRYLILFQNNNEIRPAGGFIGSYGIMDINEGRIEKLEVHDVYDIDGAYGATIEPPPELKEFTRNWRFRDSNYSPDFPTSAKAAKWLLEKEGGPSVDTVIAMNQGLLRDLLEITGPVQVGKFGALSSENYNLLLSFVIESKVWGAEDPKHILKIFVPAFREAIMKEEHVSRVGSKLYRALQQKHVMLYSGDATVQALIEAMGASGKVHTAQEQEDYLSISHIGIGGTKSEQFIEEKILHATEITADGRIEDELTITRSHLWSDETYFQWKKILNAYGFTQIPDQVIDILGRGRNEVLTRIYVPSGSTLISGDKELKTLYDEDMKRTYFLAKTEIRPGETAEIRLRYQLPYTLNLRKAEPYKLVIEKQPGSRGSVFTKTLIADKSLKNLGNYPKDIARNGAGIYIYATNLVYDRYFAASFVRE